MIDILLDTMDDIQANLQNIVNVIENWTTSQQMWEPH